MPNLEEASFLIQDPKVQRPHFGPYGRRARSTIFLYLRSQVLQQFNSLVFCRQEISKKLQTAILTGREFGDRFQKLYIWRARQQPLEMLAWCVPIILSESPPTHADIATKSRQWIKPFAGYQVIL